MLCKFCTTTILESGKSWDYHHGHVAEFRQSMRDGCLLCITLADHLCRHQRKLESWFSNAAVSSSVDDAAIYRWTLRPAPKIREGRDSIVLTFRPVSNEATEKIPDRQFHLLPEENVGTVPSVDRLGKRTDSGAAWSQVIQWMDNCTKSHPKCVKRHTQQGFVPTRLLDVGSKWPPDFVRVVDTAKVGIYGPYMTLSHCWGPKEKQTFVQLQDHNLNDFTTKGVPWHLVSTNRNFVDAIQVAQKLAVRYLWIDSLCIIQRQQGHADLRETDFYHEAQRMHQVYRNSYCNIASADSPDKDDGLFRDRGDRLSSIDLPLFKPRGDSVFFRSKTWRVVPEDLYQEQLLGKVLYSRGWVFQERLLSPRLLHFSRDQIFWDCATITACETLPSGLPLQVDGRARIDRHWRQRLQHAALRVRDIGDASVEDFWQAAVRYYTTCNLGVAGDKLNAIWGVAKLVRDALSEDYGAGLWSNALHEQLAWRVADPGAASRPSEQDQFPSWSWASVNGIVEVAPRVPAWPRWYVATGHDGKDLAFRLERYLYRRVAVSGSSKWDDEFVAMDRNISAAVMEGRHLTEERIKLPKVEEARSNPNEPTSEASAPAGESSHRLDSTDEFSKLDGNSIEVQGHVIHGSLKRGKENGGWLLTTDSQHDSDLKASIRAFPDTAPDQDECQTSFVILAASRHVNDEWSPRDDDDQGVEEEDLEEAIYTGLGIMVEHVANDHFRRTGSFTFSALDHEAWTRLRMACCQRVGAGTDHPLEEGQLFWIQ